jgi:hypothetical protein
MNSIPIGFRRLTTRYAWLPQKLQTGWTWLRWYIEILEWRGDQWVIVRSWS